MKRKRKNRYFDTEEEYRAWRKQADENFRELRRLIDRAKAERAAKQQPQS